MTRFFMTIPEAAWLILDAAALGHATATCSCWTWASRSASWTSPATSSGSRAATPTASRFEIVGLRPGEKLHEELFYDAEQVEPTSSAKVLRAIAPPPPWDVRDAVREMLALATGEHDDALRAALMAYAAEHAGPVADPGQPDLDRGVSLGVIAVGRSQPLGALKLTRRRSLPSRVAAPTLSTSADERRHRRRCLRSPRGRWRGRPGVVCSRYGPLAAARPGRSRRRRG